MSGIYIRDLNLKKVGQSIEGVRVPSRVIQQTLKLIAPAGINSFHGEEQPLGYSIKYPYDENNNFVHEEKYSPTMLE